MEKITKKWNETKHKLIIFLLDANEIVECCSFPQFSMFARYNFHNLMKTFSNKNRKKLLFSNIVSSFASLQQREESKADLASDFLP